MENVKTKPADYIPGDQVFIGIGEEVWAKEKRVFSTTGHGPVDIFYGIVEQHFNEGEFVAFVTNSYPEDGYWEEQLFHCPKEAIAWAKCELEKKITELKNTSTFADGLRIVSI